MGFTVSLFVAGLAFPNRELEAAANVGITIASAAAAIAGALLSSGERDPPGANSRRQTRSPQDPDGHQPTFLPPPARHVRTQPRSNSEPRSILRIPATKPVTMGSR